jgi:NADH:ubiquinone oxidoreductase subunit 6 (subunit J)
MNGGLYNALVIGIGIVAGLSALYAVLTMYLLRSIMAFGAFLTAVAGEFYLLAADFVAVIQIFVYVGGVVVLILFALMLSSSGQRSPLAAATRSAFGLILCYVLGGWLVFAAWREDFPEVAAAPEDTVQRLGDAFLTEQLYPFELIGVILLAAVVAALVIVRGERQ